MLLPKGEILLENSSGIYFHDLRMEIKQGNALEAKDSKNIIWDMVSVSKLNNDFPFLKLINCQGIKVSNCYQEDKIGVFVSEDEKCSDIYIVNNVLPGAILLKQ